MTCRIATYFTATDPDERHGHPGPIDDRGRQADMFMLSYDADTDTPDNDRLAYPLLQGEARLREHRATSNGDNIYEVTVRASDGEM